MREPPTIDDVYRAAPRVAGFALPSPVAQVSVRTPAGLCDVSLKLESFQPTGSFKVRGAANALVAGSGAAPRSRGVVTFSTGNHGRAVAFVAEALRLPVTVCVAESVPEAKLRRLRDSAAEVHVEGAIQADAAEVALRLAESRGLDLIDPFDDPRVIAGQGTIGLELASHCAADDVVVVPVSGGGLVGGVALAIKSLRSDVRVVGVCADRAPAMYDSLRAGRPVESAESDTVADSLRGGIGLANRWTLELVRAHVDELVVVPEEHIEHALVSALVDWGLVLEGAAVVGLAAVQNGLIDVAGAHITLVITGRNADANDIVRLARKDTHG